MRLKLQRKLTNKEWTEIAALGPGVRNYRGKKTLFWNGEKLFDEDFEEYLIYNQQERDSWQVVIVLPGVRVIPDFTFDSCTKLETVIMADTVRRIEDWAFECCSSLEFVRLSRNLEYIGVQAFCGCESLTSIFIPPSCREVADSAFRDCKELIMFNVPQSTELGVFVIAGSALIDASTFQADEIGHYQGTLAVNEWIKSINDGEGLALHGICSSDNPDMEEVYVYVKHIGLQAMKLQNSIGITPSQYLAANPYSEIEEAKLVKRYILEMMGEVV